MQKSDKRGVWETNRSGVEGHSWLHNELEGNLNGLKKSKSQKKMEERKE